MRLPAPGRPEQDSHLIRSHPLRYKIDLVKAKKFLALGLRPSDLFIFLLYVVVLCIFIPFHEPWADEAQAWALSRDLSIPSLLFHFLRHEGHPALWYLLLWFPIHLGLPYSLFGWLSGAIAAGGIWVLLRYAPFPFYLRALLPFTFFLAYQYAIVARSYVLFPLLAFIIAHLYLRQKPLAMAVALSLLANTSLHGTLIALAFAGLYANRLRKLNRTQRPPAQQLWSAAAIFFASILLVAICLWPTAGALPQFSPAVTRVIDRLSIPESTPVEPIPPPVPQSTPAAKDNQAAPPPAASAPGLARLKTAPSILGYAFAKSWKIALLFQLAVLVYLARCHALGLATPFIVLAAFLVFVYRAPWHLGLLWVTTVMVLWVAWDQAAPHIPAATLQNAVGVSLALLCVLQLPWTADALLYDLRHATSPDKATAAYLSALPPDTRIAGFGMSVGVQPYFPHNIFYNQPFAFAYLGRDRPKPTIQQSLQQPADVIVADPLQAEEIKSENYRQTAEFCGSSYFPNQALVPDCLLIFIPSATLSRH